MQNQALFSDLKLRVSYGRAGNQGISPYSTLQQLAVCWYSFGGTEFNSLCPRSTEGNPALTWESQNQGNVGLDASLLKNRVTVSLDAYHSVTHNLLLTVPLPITTGFSSQPQNVGFEYLKSIAHSLLRQGFRRQVYLSAHGPSNQYVSGMVRDFFDSARVDGALQRARLAGVLRFYFERARRYGLLDASYEATFLDHLARLIARRHLRDNAFQETKPAKEKPTRRFDGEPNAR